MGMIFTSALEMKRRRLDYIECSIPSRGITNKMHVHGKRTINFRKNRQNETLSLVSKLTVICLMFLHTHFTGLLPSGKTPEKKEIISMSGKYSRSFMTGPRKFETTRKDKDFDVSTETSYKCKVTALCESCTARLLQLPQQILFR